MDGFTVSIVDDAQNQEEAKKNSECFINHRDEDIEGAKLGLCACFLSLIYSGLRG